MKSEPLNTYPSWRVHVEAPRYWRKQVDLSIWRPVKDLTKDLIEVVTGFNIATYSAYTDDVREGNLPLETQDVQALMDSLWNIGFRPSEGTGSAGSLKATQDHLKTVQDVMSRTLTLVEKGWEKP